LRYKIGYLKPINTIPDVEIRLNYPYYKHFMNAAPFVNKSSKKEKVNGVEVITTTYNKSCSYEGSYEYNITDNVADRKLAGKKDTWLWTVTTPEYSTEAEANQAWEAYSRSRISEVCTAQHNKVAAEIGRIVAALFYKGDATTTVDLYKMKDKEDYADLDSAYTIALEAYKLLSNHTDTDRTAFTKAVQPAMEIWKRVVAQKEDSRKARVNNKVASVVLYNLAMAAYWSKDWDGATTYANAADENGKRDDWVKDFEKNVAVAKKQGSQ
jgi:hypothetical protein